MTQVTKYIERFLCVLTPAAEIKVIQLDEVTAIDGVPVKSEQVGASTVTDPKVSALLEAISAKTFENLNAERNALATVTTERNAQKAIADTVPGLREQLATVTAEKEALQTEVDRLTALVPPPVPDAFLSADWPRFRNAILSDEAVQRVAIGNPTAWPLMVLYLAQLSSQPSRGVDIAQLWTVLEANTPITPDEVARINAIAAECGVPLRMNADGSIG